MLKENDTLASHTTALNKLRDVCIVLCSEGLSTQPKLVVCLETELAKPHQMLSWQSVTAHSALTSAWTHCIFLHFRCSQYFKLICSIKTLKTLLADTQKQIQFFHLFSAMKQTPAKVAAELRSPQRGNSLGWARGAAQLPSVPAEGLALQKAPNSTAHEQCYLLHPLLWFSHCEGITSLGQDLTFL